MAGALELTKSDLSDLFGRYPDIKFDSAGDIAPACGISEDFSSPCSNATNYHDTPPNNTNSTAHTTPIWPRTRSIDESHLPSLSLFLNEVKAADIPFLSKEGFRTLATEFVVLGSLLVPHDGEYYEGNLDSNKPKILHRTQSVLTDLRQANDKVKDEIDNIDFVRTRAPFAVEPGMEDLWCNYRQRAKLIAQYGSFFRTPMNDADCLSRYISLPCRAEKDLLEEITHLFDAYVYNCFLELCSLGEIDGEIEDAINVAYDILMTLLRNYSMWMEGMKNLKENHLQPLLRRIKVSPETLRGIAEAEFVKAMAKASIESSEAPGMQPADERTIQELNLSTRSRHGLLPRRATSRYRREHTV